MSSVSMRWSARSLRGTPANLQVTAGCQKTFMHKIIASRLRSERMKWGLTQRELAPLLLIRHATQLSRIEKGRRSPSVHTLLASTLVFGENIERLYPGLSEDVEDRVVKSAYSLFKRVERKHDPVSRKKQELLRTVAAKQKVRCK